MIRTVEAVIGPKGEVQLLEPIELPGAHRALVTILEAKKSQTVPQTALLSEEALGHDWNRPEEDEAWSHLQ